MCGRYSLTTPSEAMRRLFGFVNPLPNLPPRYNIAPTQAVPIVRLVSREHAAHHGENRERELVQVRWGLIPFWAKDASIGAKMINARAESIAAKPAFRQAFKSRRCLVPADGFYEWQAGPKGKRPYRIELKGERGESSPLFAFAGLWERWEKSPDGLPVESCTIVTTEANALLRPIHERMPVILGSTDHATWLDPDAAARTAEALLKPYAAEAMQIYPISTRINSVRFDDAACIIPEEAEETPAQPRLI